MSLTFETGGSWYQRVTITPSQDTQHKDYQFYGCRQPGPDYRQPPGPDYRQPGPDYRQPPGPDYRQPGPDYRQPGPDYRQRFAPMQPQTYQSSYNQPQQGLLPYPQQGLLPFPPSHSYYNQFQPPQDSQPKPSFTKSISSVYPSPSQPSLPAQPKSTPAKLQPAFLLTRKKIIELPSALSKKSPSFEPFKKTIPLAKKDITKLPSGLSKSPSFERDKQPTSQKKNVLKKSPSLERTSDQVSSLGTKVVTKLPQQKTVEQPLQKTVEELAPPDTFYMQAKKVHDEIIPLLEQSTLVKPKSEPLLEQSTLFEPKPEPRLEQSTLFEPKPEQRLWRHICLEYLNYFDINDCYAAIVNFSYKYSNPAYSRHRKKEIFEANEKVLNQFARIIREHISEFNPSQIANLANAFGSIGINDKGLWTTLSQATKAKIDGFTAEELCNLAIGFGKAGCDDAALFQLIADKTIAEIKELNPKQVANLIWAFGACNITNDKLFRLVARRVIDDVSTFRPKELAKLAWAYAVVAPGSLNFDFVFKHLNTVAQFLNETDCITLDHVQLAQNVSWSELDVLRVKVQEICEKHSTTQPVSSTLHREVSSALECMDVAHDNEMYKHGYFVDIVIKNDSLAIEVDGPHHRLHSGGEKGSDLLKHRILEAYGLKVIHIPHDQWWKLGRTLDRQKNYLNEMLDLKPTVSQTTAPLKHKPLRHNPTPTEAKENKFPDRVPQKKPQTAPPTTNKKFSANPRSLTMSNGSRRPYK